MIASLLNKFKYDATTSLMDFNKFKLKSNYCITIFKEVWTYEIISSLYETCSNLFKGWCNHLGSPAAAALRRRPCGGGPAATIKWLFWAWISWNLFKCILTKKKSKSSLRYVTKVFLEPRRLAAKNIGYTIIDCLLLST